MLNEVDKSFLFNKDISSWTSVTSRYLYFYNLDLLLDKLGVINVNQGIPDSKKRSLIAKLFLENNMLDNIQDELFLLNAKDFTPTTYEAFVKANPSNELNVVKYELNKNSNRFFSYDDYDFTIVKVISVIKSSNVELKYYFNRYKNEVEYYIPYNSNPFYYKVNIKSGVFEHDDWYGETLKVNLPNDDVEIRFVISRLPSIPVNLNLFKSMADTILNNEFDSDGNMQLLKLTNYRIYSPSDNDYVIDTIVTNSLGEGVFDITINDDINISLDGMGNYTAIIKGEKTVCNGFIYNLTHKTIVRCFFSGNELVLEFDSPLAGPFNTRIPETLYTIYGIKNITYHYVTSHITYEAVGVTNDINGNNLLSLDCLKCIYDLDFKHTFMAASYALGINNLDEKDIGKVRLQLIYKLYILLDEESKWLVRTILPSNLLDYSVSNIKSFDVKTDFGLYTKLSDEFERVINILGSGKNPSSTISRQISVLKRVVFTFKSMVYEGDDPLTSSEFKGKLAPTSPIKQGFIQDIISDFYNYGFYTVYPISKPYLNQSLISNPNPTITNSELDKVISRLSILLSPIETGNWFVFVRDKRVKILSKSVNPSTLFKEMENLFPSSKMETFTINKYYNLHVYQIDSVYYDFTVLHESENENIFAWIVFDLFDEDKLTKMANNNNLFIKINSRRFSRKSGNVNLDLTTIADFTRELNPSNTQLDIVKSTIGKRSTMISSSSIRKLPTMPKPELVRSAIKESYKPPVNVFGSVEVPVTGILNVIGQFTGSESIKEGIEVEGRFRNVTKQMFYNCLEKAMNVTDGNSVIYTEDSVYIYGSRVRKFENSSEDQYQIKTQIGSLNSINGIRFTVSKEEDITLSNITDANLIKEIQTGRTLKRNRKRWKINYSGTYVDLTIVDTSYNLGDKWGNNRIKYEVEVECINSPKDDNFKTVLEEVFSWVNYGSPYIFTMEQRNSAINLINNRIITCSIPMDYRSKLNGKNIAIYKSVYPDANYRNITTDPSNVITSDIVSNARNIKRGDLITTSVISTYAISAKADGFTRLLSFTEDGIWLFFPPTTASKLVDISELKFNSNYTQAEYKRNLLGTSFTCEFIPSENRNKGLSSTRAVVAIFDLSSTASNYNLVDMTYEKRLELAASLLKTPLLGESPIISKLVLNVIMKRVYWTNGSVKDVNNKLTNILEYKEGYPFEIDGAIMTPNLAPQNVSFSSNFKNVKDLPLNKRSIDFSPDILKIKPFDNLTIDFAFSFDKKQIYVATFSEGSYKLSEFTGTRRYPFNASTDVAWESLKDKLPNTVGEFSPTKINGKIVFNLNRLRIDKEMPNFASIANDVWNDINSESIVDFIEPTSFARVFEHHNRIKKFVINDAFNKVYKQNSLVLDIGSGRGGDIYKIMSHKPSKIIFVEPNDDNRLELIERLKIFEGNDQIDEEKYTILGTGGEDTNTILPAVIKALNSDKTINTVIISMMLSLSFFFNANEHELFKGLMNTISSTYKAAKNLNVVFAYVTVDGAQLVNTVKKYGVDGNLSLGKANIRVPCMKPGIKCSDREHNMVKINIDDSIVQDQTEYLVDINKLNYYLQPNATFNDLALSSTNANRNYLFLSTEEDRFNSMYSYGVIDIKHPIIFDTNRETYFFNMARIAIELANIKSSSSTVHSSVVLNASSSYDNITKIIGDNYEAFRNFVEENKNIKLEPFSEKLRESLIRIYKSNRVFKSPVGFSEDNAQFLSYKYTLNTNLSELFESLTSINKELIAVEIPGQKSGLKTADIISGTTGRSMDTILKTNKPLMNDLIGTGESLHKKFKNRYEKSNKYHRLIKVLSSKIEGTINNDFTSLVETLSLVPNINNVKVIINTDGSSDGILNAVTSKFGVVAESATVTNNANADFIPNLVISSFNHEDEDCTILNEVILCLTKLEKSGTMVLKSNIFYRRFSYSLILTLSNLFDKAYICRPETSCGTDLYFVGIGLKGDVTNVVEYCKGQLVNFDNERLLNSKFTVKSLMAVSTAIAKITNTIENTIQIKSKLFSNPIIEGLTDSSFSDQMKPIYNNANNQWAKHYLSINLKLNSNESDLGRIFVFPSLIVNI